MTDDRWPMTEIEQQAGSFSSSYQFSLGKGFVFAVNHQTAEPGHRPSVIGHRASSFGHRASESSLPHLANAREPLSNLNQQLIKHLSSPPVSPFLFDFFYLLFDQR
jgi:hypothetical protein